MQSLHSLRSLVLNVIFAVMVLASSAPIDCLAQRPLPAGDPHSDGVRTRGYCPSSGGSTVYEEIGEVRYQIRRDSNKMDIFVEVLIHNPDGCFPNGPECPQYDSFPVNINAWIDWTGGDQLWEYAEQALDETGTPRDTGYQDMEIHGQIPLTGWKPQSNPSPWMRVNIGWGTDPDACESEWEWGDVEDVQLHIDKYSIDLVMADGLYQNYIYELFHDFGHFPPWDIWDEELDTDCNLIPNTLDYPLSFPTTRTITFKAWIKPCVEDTDSPTVLPSWTIERESETPIEGESPSVSTWDPESPPDDRKVYLEFAVNAPGAVGLYDLNLQFDVETAQGQKLTLEVPERQLFVTLFNNKGAYTGISLYDNVAPELWYDYACDWGDGATDETEVLDSVRERIYQNELVWDYGYLDNNPGKKCDWWQLFEELDPTSVNCQSYNTDCFGFTDVLYNLSGVLGVAGLEKSWLRGEFEHGFVTTPGERSLDLMFPGNVGERNPTDPNDPPLAYDRYFFISHSMLRTGDGTIGTSVWHDATFNKSLLDSSDAYYWNVTDISSEPYPTDSGDSIRAIEHDIHLSWDGFEYFPTLLPSLLARGPSIAPFTVGGWTPKSAGSENLQFTGDVAYHRIDLDDNGIAEALAVDAEIETFSEGLYFIDGCLYDGDNKISFMPRYESEIMSAYSFEGSPDTYVAHLEFSGEDIFEYDLDDDYDLQLIAYDLGGAGDTLITETPFYAHTQFGEYMADMAWLAEELVDSDDDDFYDSLRVSFTITPRDSGEFTLVGGLYADSTLITSTGVLFGVESEERTVHLDFKGQDIRKKGLNGPYSAVVTLVDSLGRPFRSLNHTTPPYQAGIFDRSFLRPTGFFDDMVIDSDGDNDMDILRVRFGLNAESAETITLTGWLNEALGREGGVGRVIAVASDSASTSPGPQILSLDFDGAAIGRQEVDGPYILSFVEALDESLKSIDRVELGFATEFYPDSIFDPGPPVVTYLGGFIESLIDTDEDGLGDSLEVWIDVECSEAGIVKASADLHDKNGRFIVNATGEVNVLADIPTMLPIRFDGRYIFGNQEHGPFEVRDAYLYHIMNVSGGTVVEYLGTTSDYRSDDFEPAGVIRGVVESAPHVRAVGAEVRCPEFVDYTDEEGRYRLIFLEDVTTTVRAIYEETTEWSIVLNGEFIHTGDSADVDVAVGEIDELVFLKVDPTDAPDSDILTTLEPGLHGNAPNPFSLSTEIMFVIPSAEESVHVRLRVYDPAGRLVRRLIDDSRTPGVYRIRWDGCNDRGESVNAGVYFYRLNRDGKIETDRMILVK